MECCKYFQQQEFEENEERAVSMVTLLTDFETDASADQVSSSGIKNMMKMSESENIDIKNISSFYDDWKFDLKN